MHRFAEVVYRKPVCGSELETSLLEDFVLRHLAEDRNILRTRGCRLERTHTVGDGDLARFLCRFLFLGLLLAVLGLLLLGLGFCRTLGNLGMGLDIVLHPLHRLAWRLDIVVP